MDAIGLTISALIGAAQVAASELPLDAPQAAEQVDFSTFALFLRATPTVQAVMIMLILASFWSWAIIVEKALSFRKLWKSSGKFEDEFWSGQPLDKLFDRIGSSAKTPMERVFVAGMTEWNRSIGQEGGLLPGTLQRVERAMNVTIARETEGIGKRLPFLASVGSVSPFVGLFGTVWGIKHAFEAIATQQNTNLAVVAPGIAEALFATALGLLAAIPAVIAYNRLNTDADRLSGSLENFADEFSTILGRQIDRAMTAARTR
ncbi:MAG: protein TolQ [Pseudomonadota bacterium]